MTPGLHYSFGKRAAIGAVILIVGCGIAGAQGASPPPAVSVAPVVSRQVTQTGDFIGRVTAIDKVDIVARVPGFIEERNFTEGQHVKKGDLLFLIEQATYKAAVDQQRANLAKAKATEVNTALQLQRGKELVRNSNIPQSTVDQRAADDAAAKADVMQAQATLEQAEINLGYTEIRSQIDGRIGLAIFTVGNFVQPSSGTLATIVSEDPIYVIFQVSERDVIAYRARVAKSPDKTPHVTTERGEPQSALVVPQSAVQLDQAGHYVLLVDPTKKVELRRVTTGVERGRDIVVTDGLKEGELVIVEGIQKVHPGQVVTASVVPGN